MDAYLCGPPPMVDAAMALLEAKGVPESRVYHDKFTTTAPFSAERRATDGNRNCRPGQRAQRSQARVHGCRGRYAGVPLPLRVTRLTIQHAASVAALMLTTEALVAEELIAQPGAIIAPGFGDLAEGLARPSSPV